MMNKTAPCRFSGFCKGGFLRFGDRRYKRRLTPQVKREKRREKRFGIKRFPLTVKRVRWFFGFALQTVGCFASAYKKTAGSI